MVQKNLYSHMFSFALMTSPPLQDFTGLKFGLLSACDHCENGSLHT